MSIKSHRIRLEANNKQRTYFAKASGVARKAYNYGLAEWKKMYESKEKVSEGIIRKKLNAVKKELFSYMLEVTKCAAQLAIKEDLKNGFDKFFRKEAGYPRFKKKGIRDSFHISNDQFSIKKNYIRVPKLGWVKLAEHLRFEGKILSATISREANHWYVSVVVETPEETKVEMTGETAGIDLGISTFVTIANENEVKTYTGAKPHKRLSDKLRRLSKSLSRKQKASKNREKAKRKLAKLHVRISNIRNDVIEKVTTEIVRNNDIVGIEDLNVKGMQSNRRLAKSISDMGFRRFRDRLKTKLELQGKKIVVIDRWYASSKECSSCSYIKTDLKLSDRKWECPNCQGSHDRDVNAAKNIRKKAVSSTVSVCGISSNGGTGSNIPDLRVMVC